MVPTRRSVSERVRVTASLAIGAVALVIALVLGPWQLAVLIGWVAAALVLLGWIWSEIAGLDAERTAAVATREDDSRAAATVVIVSASTISLVGVVIALHRASTAGSRLEVALSVAALVTVVVSWLTVHTFFILRYAHLYYRGDQIGGVEFPGEHRPAYRDFAYLGFTVGMTFQVSDTELSDPIIRRAVLRHALLSYLFGTAIVASTISVLSGLVI